MKILLINPPWLKFFGRSLTSPSVSLNSIASYIKRELPEVQIDIYNADHSHDAVNQISNSFLFANGHAEYLKRLNNLSDIIWQDAKKIISDYQPDIVGISAMTASFISGLNISKLTKQINPEILVVFGGKHSTALPEDTLKHSTIDFIVIGEGEETFKELILNINSPENIRGIAYKNQNGKIIKTLPREYIADINKLPIPVFKSSINSYCFEKGINLETYKWTIISARGCPFQCVYCASDKKIRYRSPQNVLSEISFVKKEYGIQSFDFQDDSFSINKNRALELCNLLKKEKITWECNTRVDLIDEEIVSNMKQSGCNTVWIGIETGSEKTLKLINKKISIETIYQAISLFKKYNMFVCGFFIIGFPWENKNDMEKTFKLIKTLSIDNFELNIATPLPGTKMFNALVNEGKINVSTETWCRFHQGSPKMNFSSYYSDKEWEKIILHYTYLASKIHKQKLIKRLPQLFIHDPIKTSKRITSILKFQLNKWK